MLRSRQNCWLSSQIACKGESRRQSNIAVRPLSHAPRPRTHIPTRSQAYHAHIHAQTQVVLTWKMEGGMGTRVVACTFRDCFLASSLLVRDSVSAPVDPLPAAEAVVASTGAAFTDQASWGMKITV